MSDVRSKSGMVNSLKEGVCEVTFNKVNGDLRVMSCTLDMGFVPESFLPKGNGTISELVVSVWDVKSHGWRSFRPENVTEFKYLYNYEGQSEEWYDMTKEDFVEKYCIEDWDRHEYEFYTYSKEADDMIEEANRVIGV
jgi:hypothetical protein